MYFNHNTISNLYIQTMSSINIHLELGYKINIINSILNTNLYSPFTTPSTGNSFSLSISRLPMTFPKLSFKIFRQTHNILYATKFTPTPSIHLRISLNTSVHEGVNKKVNFCSLNIIRLTLVLL